ncbi:MAG: hypothetical protein Q4P24_06660 [Rhodobacterales bacterium]|nr:hypothetical protein [Rhodobacterales bacterium]
MADDSKILTVSYGSFSCTLEGFEDPLATMKEIAEYFRDLSTSDRPLNAKTGPRGIEVLDPEDSDFRVHLRADDLSDATAMKKWSDTPSYRGGTDGPSGDESIADKLRRLRAVAAGTDPTASRNDYAEDENVDDFLANFVAHATEPDPAPTPGDAAAAEDIQARFSVDENPPDEGTSEGATLDDLAGTTPSFTSARDTLEEGAGSNDVSETREGSERTTAPVKQPHPLHHPEEPRAEVLRTVKTTREGPSAPMIAGTLRQTVPPDSSGVAVERDSSASDAQSGRMFAEAAAQFEEKDAHHRRSALQHLRAAVSATDAERKVGGAMAKGVDDQPYRLDLKHAVRPRRSQPSATPRPAAVPRGRTAVLKLVASQRVDTVAESATPLRSSNSGRTTPAKGSRSSGTSNGVESTISFSAFARQKGATTLGDLLEAAAAYLADVGGTPEFSRPMLMQTLQEARSDEFSREDGLRAFAFLLRQGKLRKLEEGRFGITDSTKFRFYA